jgi:hypothetical protein
MKTVQSQGKKVSSGAAGAGSGTLVVAIANAISPNSTLHTVLLYAAPSLSIAAGWLATVLNSQVGYYQRKFVYNRTLKTLKKTLQNSDTGEGHKAKIRAQIEALEAKYTQSEAAAATSIFRRTRQA